MACRARIIADPVNIPGLPLFHKTTRCPNKAEKKITTDDGDAHVPICLACFRRFITKGLRDPSRNLWLGWFDDSIPAAAQIKGSAWYYEQLRSYWEAQQPAAVVEKCRGQVFPPSWYRQLEQGLIQAVASADAEETDELADLNKDMKKLSIQDKASTKAQEKAIIQAQIDVINSWMKGEGRILYKQQPAKHKELMKLKAQLRLL